MEILKKYALHAACMIMMLTGMVVTKAQNVNYEEDDTQRNNSAYIAKHANKLAQKIVKEWKSRNTNLMASQRQEMLTNIDTVVVSRYICTSDNGTDLKASTYRKPVSYIELWSGKNLMGYASVSETNTTMVEAVRYADSDGNEPTMLRDIAQKHKVFTLTGTGHVGKFFYYNDANELTEVDYENLTETAADVKEMAQTAFANSKRHARPGAVLLTALGGGGVCAMLVCIMLL